MAHDGRVTDHPPVCRLKTGRWTRVCVTFPFCERHDLGVSDGASVREDDRPATYIPQTRLQHDLGLEPSETRSVVNTRCVGPKLH